MMEPTSGSFPCRDRLSAASCLISSLLVFIDRPVATYYTNLRSRARYEVPKEAKIGGSAEPRVCRGSGRPELDLLYM